MASYNKHLISCLSDGRTVLDGGAPNTAFIDEHIDNSEIKSNTKTDVMKKHMNISVVESKIREWEEQMNCDIEIKCGEFQIKVHLDVLSDISLYFKAYINLKGNARTIFLTEQFVSSEAIWQVIKFAYSGDLEISSDSVQDLLETASYLLVELILNECEKFLINSIDLSTAISFLQYASIFNLNNLIESIVPYISENFDTFDEQNLFCTLSNKEFKFLLMKKNLSVFRKGIPVNKDITIVEDILSAILFSEIPEDDLSSIYDSHPAFHTIDRFTFKTLQTRYLKERKFSNSSKILESCMSYLEVPDHLNFMKCFEKVPSINDRVKKVGLWVTRWEGSIVIGGIRMEYRSGTSVLYGIPPKARHLILSEHEFELDDDEVITSINLRSDMLTYGITFFTNYGRTYGPYGSSGGIPSFSTPSQKRGYFHSFRGIVLKGRYDHFIAIIDCTWVVFKTTKKDNDRIVKERSKFDDYIRMRVNYESDWRKHSWGSRIQNITSVVESVDSEPYVVFENKASLSYKF